MAEIEAEIEAEVRQKAPEFIKTVQGFLAEDPDMTLGDLASIIVLALRESNAAWYLAYFAMEAAKATTTAEEN